MTLRATLLTLGVRDLARSREFYTTGMGLTPSAQSNENVVFFDLGGLVMSLYGRDALADDAQLPADGSGFRSITVSHNVDSREAVDAVIARAREAGATILKEPQAVFWGGYSSYFADPDGHLWEVAHNPFWSLDERGAVVLPD